MFWGSVQKLAPRLLRLPSDFSGISVRVRSSLYRCWVLSCKGSVVTSLSQAYATHIANDPFVQSLLRCVYTPVVLPHIEIPSLKMVWHGSSRCADHENTNFKTNVPAPSEILRCQVLAWLAWFWLFLAAQTIAESKNLTYFLATLILKMQNHTTLNYITSKGPIQFF